MTFGSHRNAAFCGAAVLIVATGVLYIVLVRQGAKSSPVTTEALSVLYNSDVKPLIWGDRPITSVNWGLNMRQKTEKTGGKKVHLSLRGVNGEKLKVQVEALHDREKRQWLLTDLRLSNPDTKEQWYFPQPAVNSQCVPRAMPETDLKQMTPIPTYVWGCVGLAAVGSVIYSFVTYKSARRLRPFHLVKQAALTHPKVIETLGGPSVTADPKPVGSLSGTSLRFAVQLSGTREDGLLNVQTLYDPSSKQWAVKLCTLNVKGRSRAVPVDLQLKQ